MGLRIQGEYQLVVGNFFSEVYCIVKRSHPWNEYWARGNLKNMNGYTESRKKESTLKLPIFFTLFWLFVCLKLSYNFLSQLWPRSHWWYLCHLNLWSLTFPVWEEDTLVALESVYCSGQSNHAESCIRPTILWYLQLCQPKPYCASFTAHIIWRVLSREGNYCSWAAGECIDL